MSLFFDLMFAFMAAIFAALAVFQAVQGHSDAAAIYTFLGVFHALMMFCFKEPR